MGYNFVADNAGLSSFCLAVIASVNTRNVAKFQENLTLQQFKVIQGHRSWCQWKANMWLPIVIEIFKLTDRKLLILLTPPLFDAHARVDPFWLLWWNLAPKY